MPAPEPGAWKKQWAFALGVIIAAAALVLGLMIAFGEADPVAVSSLVVTVILVAGFAALVEWARWRLERRR